MSRGIAIAEPYRGHVVSNRSLPHVFRQFLSQEEASSGAHALELQIRHKYGEVRDALISVRLMQIDAEMQPTDNRSGCDSA